MRNLRAGLICLLAICSAGTASAQTWYLENATLILDPSNRYIATLVATNPGNAPIYVRAQVSRLDIKDGKRKRSLETRGMLGIYPEEFIVPPHSSFNIRLVADTSKLDGASQSLYLQLRDVSKTEAHGNAGVGQAVLLAYDVLIAVSKTRAGALEPDAFQLKRDAGRAPSLINLSTQHVFLQAGYACADNRRELFQCEAMPRFPSQSLLPGEALDLPGFDGAFLGLLLQPSLKPRTRPQALMIRADAPIPQ